MKKGPVMGISIAAVVFLILFGIASLPDEVLNESVTSESIYPENLRLYSQDTSKQLPSKDISSATTDNQLEVLKKELAVLKKELAVLKADSETLEAGPEIIDTKPEVIEKESEGRVIRVELNDGVGSGDM